MEIIDARESDIQTIHELAELVWWPTYRPILTDEQIAFMLKDMYSVESLRKQMEGNVKFILAKDVGFTGFAGYSIDNNKLKLHKLYVLPSGQGKGTGRKMIEHISGVALKEGIVIIELNVNRANPALEFYRRNGFSIKESVDIPYHQFVLNDYVMHKELTSYNG